jgi:hypothetical protein
MEYEEKIVKKKVVRDGKRIIKKTTDKENYKMVDGKEVRMSPQEIRNRSKAAKKGAKKAKSKKSQTSAKRKRSMKKRPENFVIYKRRFSEIISPTNHLKTIEDLDDYLQEEGISLIDNNEQAIDSGDVLTSDLIDEVIKELLKDTNIKKLISKFGKDILKQYNMKNINEYLKATIREGIEMA